jgi:multiple sugar transport system ATP-binding protein
VQVGTPRDVYERPASRFVAGFIGSPPMSFLPGRLAGPIPGRGDLGLRPEHVAVARGTDARDPAFHWLPDTHEVVRVEFLGHETVAGVNVGPAVLSVRLPATAGLAPGERVAVGIDPSRGTWFDAEAGAAVAV